MKIYDYRGKNNISGPRLREARKAIKLSQEELAEELQKQGIEVERDSISRMEIGSRFVADYELIKLSEILEKDIDWLLSDIDTGEASEAGAETTAEETAGFLPDEQNGLMNDYRPLDEKPEWFPLESESDDEEF